MIELFPTGWQHYLLGGLLIGASVGLLFVLTGRIGGMSTVFSSSWSFFSQRAVFNQPRLIRSRIWRLVFAVGLMLGALLWRLVFTHDVVVHTSISPLRLLLGGLLVGFGARLAGGCTSGHGICGLGSLQRPSLYAVLTFMASAFVTAWLF